MRLPRRYWLGALVLTLTGCSLAGDVSPPPGFDPPPVQQAPSLATPITESISVRPPDRRPDPASGAAIYVEKCQACHGAAGWGDGPQAAALPDAPSALADPEVAWSAEPAEWYAVVTLGRIERFMPGFTSLSDAERWDVVAYALTLIHTPEQLAQGQELYLNLCADCHAAEGQGGPDGSDLTLPGLYAQTSAEELSAVIVSGVGEAMPGFGDQLSEGERQALVAFVRSLAFAGPDAAAQEPAPSAARATVRGQVLQGTAGAKVPEGLEVTLHGFDGRDEVVNRTTTIDSQGRFAFEAVEQTPGRLFVVSAVHQGVIYGSEVRHLDSALTEMPVTIYEATTDTSQVRVDRLHLLFNFLDESTLEVVELWLLSNLGDRTVAAPQGGALEIQLPAGVSGLFFDGGILGERFLATDRGFLDTAPLRPGPEAGELAFSYTLPYNRRLEFVRPAPYPVEAVIVLAPEVGIGMRGPGLVDRGTRALGEATYHHYELSAVPAGGSIALAITGRPRAAGEPQVAGNLAIGAAVLGLALVAVGVWWFGPWRRAAGVRAQLAPPLIDPGSERTELLQAIADLDDAFEAGHIPEAGYREQREALKQRLAQAMERADD